jgi:hypothetical protein
MIRLKPAMRLEFREKSEKNLMDRNNSNVNSLCCVTGKNYLCNKNAVYT